MTVGEKIQKYRKDLGLSQEELGQKLLVSRQTISLWEKDQTVPTIDNLMRLREIFGISVDEILDIEKKERTPELKPQETYQFEFAKHELDEIHRLQRKNVYKKPVLFSLICVFLIASFIRSSASEYMIGFAIGALFIGLSSYIKGICTYKKAWKSSVDRICKSAYEYKLFENHIEVIIYRKNEKSSELKYYYTDIEQIQQFGKWLFLRINGDSFILRKSELKDNSVFYSYMHNNPAKTIKRSARNGWEVASVVLFVTSLLSIFAAEALVGAVSSANDLHIENMWLFLLLTPIPIASVILGFILRAKGYKYKKNIIAGIIMTILLCLYGSFTFVFSDVYDHSDAPILRTEQATGIDIPEYKQITTQDLTKGTQTVSRGYIYSISNIYFDNAKVEEFEKQLSSDEKWMASISNDLIGITSPLSDYGAYDYILIYNEDTSEYNTLPDDSGMYRFINVLYRSEENTMMIVEYSMNYVK